MLQGGRKLGLKQLTKVSKEQKNYTKKTWKIKKKWYNILVCEQSLPMGENYFDGP